MSESTGLAITESKTEDGTELERAIAIATQAHKGQVRRGSGIPYIEHCRAVAEGVVEIEKEAGFEIADPDLQIVAWLHDVLEDCPDEWTPERLLAEGISPRNVLAIVALTRGDDEESYYDYIMEIRENDVASFVKMADLRHNASDLEPGRKKDKYNFAHAILYMTWIEGGWIEDAG